MDKFHTDTNTAPAVKFDQGKAPLSLLDPKWLVEVAKVLQFGAKKYAAHNWRQGLAHSRLLDAALRHLNSFNDGEDLDPESGLFHLAHASCCLMFLTNLHLTRPDLDDRYTKVRDRLAAALISANKVDENGRT